MSENSRENQPDNKRPSDDEENVKSLEDNKPRNDDTEENPRTKPTEPPEQRPAPVETAVAEHREQLPEPPKVTSEAELNSRRLNRRVLLALVVAFALMLVPMMRLFLVPIVLATTFATLFYPLYAGVLKRVKNHRAVSSLITCVVLVTGLLIPAYVLIHLVTLQTIDLYHTAEPKVKEIVREGEEGILGRLDNIPLVRRITFSSENIQDVIQEGIRNLGRLGTTIVNKTSAGVLGLVGNLGITLFAMFYFFMDGEQLVSRIRYLSPLRRDYEEMLLSRFLLISRATVKGTVVIGLIQGTLGGLSLLIFGVETWLIWGFVMVVLSIIPLVGAWLVLIPAGVIQILVGDVWQGIGILVVSTVVISNIDNLLRPRLVGRGSKLHDLLIFFSTLGGIAVFGIMGFIIGPVIAALFVTIIEIYGLEYQRELTAPYTNSKA